MVEHQKLPYVCSCIVQNGPTMHALAGSFFLQLLEVLSDGDLGDVKQFAQVVDLDMPVFAKHGDNLLPALSGQ